MGLSDLSVYFLAYGHLPFGLSFIFPLGGAKPGQKNCMECGNHKEIQINPEHCSLGGKERGNKFHPIEF